MQQSALRLAFACLLGAAITAHAAYPERPLRLIVPFPPGGNIDITARAIAPGIGEILGQQIVVDNRGGAGGTIGMDLCAKALPDGYTMALGSPGALTIAPYLFPNLPYDPLKNLAAIGLVSVVPQVIVVSLALPAKSVKELIALAKARPGALRMASAGPGTTNQLVGELFQLVTGTRMIHVPYKGSGPAMIDLISGQVDLHFDQTTSSTAFIRSGKVRALAVTTAKRSGALPDVPTLDEAGVAGFDASTFSGLVFPAGVPRDIIVRVNAALNRTLATKAVRDQFAGFGAEVLETTPEQFAKFLREDLARWGKVVREAGIKLE
jgi:tripartite-type tricarboxylate transporter receptor subunit TctC